MSDLIGRKEAIEAIKRAIWDKQTAKDAIDAVCNIPSAEPEKVGKWIKQNPMVDTEECSECGYNILGEEFETPYCPWCGARIWKEKNNVGRHLSSV